MKTPIGSRGKVKESPIDERYRLLLINRYLMNIKEVPVAAGGSKWVFCCPFCSSLGPPEKVNSGSASTKKGTYLSPQPDRYAVAI
jgi:hypothetical protein